MNAEMNQIMEVIRQVKPSMNQIDMDTILNQGALDSLDIITIVSLLEKEFQVTIAGTCLKQDNFQSVQSLYTMIQHIKSEEL